VKKNQLLVILSIFSFSGYSQNYLPKDTIYGNVKKIKEKVIFLTEIENHQLLYYNDYGHSGFRGPESTIARFKDNWFTTNFCYYINYEREFDLKKNIIKDVWYGKKDDFINSYKKIYNLENKLIKEIESTPYSENIINYYYSEYNDVNIIKQNSNYKYFSHQYKKIENGKIKILKTFSDNGTVYEFEYFYSPQNKLSYRIFKNPESWKQIDDRTWSYGTHDSIITPYKDIVNTYDSKNRIIKHEEFGLYEDDEEHKNPKSITTTEYQYEGENLIFLKTKYGSGIASYNHFVYDKKNRVIEKFCCNENIKEANSIEKFTYNLNEISSLLFTSEKRTYKVSFKYKYDLNKNWIEIIKSVDGKDLFKWVRQIEYY
jgi:hypothetical protein